MPTPRVPLRLMTSEELIGDPCRDRSERQLGHWYENGGLAVEASAPETNLLLRVLDGLRNPYPVSA